MSTKYVQIDALEGAWSGRGYLVQLHFAMGPFVVAVDTDEAKNPNEALTVAISRARSAVDMKFDNNGWRMRFGDFTKSPVVLSDTDVNRKLLGVDGAEYADEIAHSEEWFDLSEVEQRAAAHVARGTAPVRTRTRITATGARRRRERTEPAGRSRAHGDRRAVSQVIRRAAPRRRVSVGARSR